MVCMQLWFYHTIFGVLTSSISAQQLSFDRVLKRVEDNKESISKQRIWILKDVNNIVLIMCMDIKPSFF